MTIEEVRLAVAHIIRVKGDDEVAHIEEDDLHQAVLRSIADETCENPVECAKLAMTTTKIDFARWHA